jgi:hypothetical protein
MSALVVASADTSQNETVATTVTVPAVVVTHDTVDSFRDIDLSTGVPDFAIRTSRTASFYSFLHGSDSEAYPLSTLEFNNRKQLHAHGLENVHNSSTVAWGFDRVKALWFGRDATTNQRYVCAIIVNELYEARFGKIFCLRKDIVELDVRPVPCFLKSGGSIRYCGTWTFQLHLETSQQPFIYVIGGCPRGAMYGMSLESYDDRWGARA